MLGWPIGWEVREEVCGLLLRRRHLEPDAWVLWLLWVFVAFGSGFRWLIRKSPGIQLSDQET